MQSERVCAACGVAVAPAYRVECTEKGKVSVWVCARCLRRLMDEMCGFVQPQKEPDHGA